MTVVASQQFGGSVGYGVGELLNDAPHHPTQPALLDAVGQPVHRHDTREVDALLAFLGYLRLGVIRPCWNFMRIPIERSPVAPLGLEEDDWVIALHSADEKPLGIVRGRAVNDFETGSMSELRFWRLRVVMPSSNPSSRGCAYRDR